MIEFLANLTPNETLILLSVLVGLIVFVFLYSILRIRRLKKLLNQPFERPYDVVFHRKEDGKYWRCFLVRPEDRTHKVFMSMGWYTDFEEIKEDLKDYFDDDSTLYRYPDSTKLSPRVIKRPRPRKR